ncbi:MAG: hypothetical protein GY948_09855 [Alphaproteobacteria bacterium]|nr:hypothetical protein [Alphaproteobacteria bacterium]
MLRAELISPPSWFNRLSALTRPGGKLSTDFVFAALSQVLGRGSLILASILVANFMTVESFSTFTYFNLTIAMIATFSTLGLGVAASRIFAESTVGLDEGKRCEARSVLFLAALSALVAVCALHAMPDTWLVGSVQLSRPVLYASVMAITVNNVLLGAMSGRGEFGLMALAASAGLVVLFSGVAAAVHFGSVDFAIWSVLLSMTVQIVIFSTRLVPLLRAKNGSDSSQMSLRLAAGVMRIAGPMFLTSLVVGTVFWFLGRSLMGGENGVAEFSKYAVGLQWFSFILLVPSITTRVFFPRIVQASVRDSDEKRKLVIMNAGANFLVAAVLGAIAMAFGDVLLSLYGNDDVTDVQVFRLFVLAAIVAAPVNGLGNAIIARDPGPRRWLLLQVGWALVALLGALHFSATGTAASMAGALLLAYLCLVPSSLVVLKQLKLL